MSNKSLEFLSRKEEPESGRSRSVAWLLPIGVFLGFGLLFLFLFRDRLLPATPVEAARVVAIPGETSAVVSAGSEGAVLFQASGWVEPDPWAVKATALVDGVVDEVHVLEGQLVAKGDPLASLISEDYELELAAAKREVERLTAVQEAHCAGIVRLREEKRGLEAQLESAKAVRDTAKDRWVRMVRSGTRAVSERDIVDARMDFERVSALVGAAEAKVSEIDAGLAEKDLETVAMKQAIAAGRIEVEKAELALSRTEIVAPIDGRVLRLHVKPGQKRSLGMDDPDSSTIAVLYDPKKLQVRVDVPLADASGLSVGQPAKIRCNLLPNEVFTGRVSRIVGEADLQRNTLQAKVEIDNPHDALRPEMLCRVEFLEQDEGGGRVVSQGINLFVSEAAVDDGRVWVIDPDSHRVSAREVSLGGEKDGCRAVLAGLRPGERVVLNPSNLRDGQRVATREP